MRSVIIYLQERSYGRNRTRFGLTPSGTLTCTVNCGGTYTSINKEGEIVCDVYGAPTANGETVGRFTPPENMLVCQTQTKPISKPRYKLGFESAPRGYGNPVQRVLKRVVDPLKSLQKVEKNDKQS